MVCHPHPTAITLRRMSQTDAAAELLQLSKAKFDNFSHPSQSIIQGRESSEKRYKERILLFPYPKPIRLFKPIGLSCRDLTFVYHLWHSYTMELVYKMQCFRSTCETLLSN